MIDLRLDTVRQAHFVGIGGCGMSGAARILLARGVRVTGSDQTPGHIARDLESRGVRLMTGHAPDNILDGTDLVVMTAAASPSNPELLEAMSRGIRIVKYAAVLGALMEPFRGIAIAGTHGKTTTTSMAATILMEGGFDPTFVIGGEVDALGGNARAGGGPFFVAEACEYDRSFLNLHPEAAVVTNVEVDHVDYYRDLDEIVDSFRTFVAGIRPKGLAVVHESAAPALASACGSDVRIASYGLSEGVDFRIRSVNPIGSAAYSFVLDRRGFDEPLRIRLKVPGTHNVLNAAGAAAALSSLGVPGEAIERGLARFEGAKRRFQHKGDVGGVRVIDDYAHHPTEIRAVLDTARASFPERRIWVVFQPHQASRTRFFLDEFASALHGADRVVVSDIYFARDSEIERASVSSGDLAARVGRLGTDAVSIPSMGEILEYLRGQLRPGDVVFTMGAGDVTRLSEQLLGGVVPETHAR